jgi:hypothetical protein
MPHTYWNALSGMCLAQSPILGAACEQDMKMCREDLNYTYDSYIYFIFSL